MAEDQDNSQKTEDPTQRKLEEARKKGDVAKSPDVPIWFLILATAAIMAGGRAAGGHDRRPAGAHHGPPACLPAGKWRRAAD